MDERTRRRTYQTWSGMRQRCNNPRSPEYHNYGGRGISVCERWMESFANFLADMGPKPEGLSIDRINNDGNYEPDNCRWATAAEQRKNQRTCHYIEFNGRRLTLTDWARELGMNPLTLSWRINTKKWPIEYALTAGIYSPKDILKRRHGQLPNPTAMAQKGGA